MDLSSEWIVIRQMALLSGIEPVWYDCCINSCVAYTQQYTDLRKCPLCDQDPFGSNGKARKVFGYLPLIPRLQGFFQNPKMVKKLSYRHRYVHTPGSISDVFDSQSYRQLLRKEVVVDGEVLPHHFFLGKYDISISICLDAFLLFQQKQGGPSATPILLQNYNLPPEIHTHLGNLICLGLIPGPSGPKDLQSFLVPFNAECAKLAHGVRTFDSVSLDSFYLRAYNLFGLGDMVAIAKMLGIKGHNGFSPCHSCEIKGVRDVSGGGTIYYVPLRHPDIAGEPPRSWDPESLPL